MNYKSIMVPHSITAFRSHNTTLLHPCNPYLRRFVSIPTFSPYIIDTRHISKQLPSAAFTGLHTHPISQIRMPESQCRHHTCRTISSPSTKPLVYDLLSHKRIAPWPLSQFHILKQASFQRPPYFLRSYPVFPHTLTRILTWD